ncbi:Cytochrome b5 reductase 4, partial [Pseudolycoriella hygida]
MASKAPNLNLKPVTNDQPKEQNNETSPTRSPTKHSIGKQLLKPLQKPFQLMSGSATDLSSIDKSLDGCLRVVNMDDTQIDDADRNPRNKCALKPGHSLMDWIRLGTSGCDLAGTGGIVSAQIGSIYILN